MHTQWDADSEAALLSLGADVAVFVGDFGEETVQVRGCWLGSCLAAEQDKMTDSTLACLAAPWLVARLAAGRSPAHMNHIPPRCARCARTAGGARGGRPRPQGGHPGQPRCVVRTQACQGAACVLCRGSTHACPVLKPLAPAVPDSSDRTPAILLLPAPPRPLNCRFSLTPNGRRRYARAMLAGSLLSARHESSEGGPART